MSSVLSSPSSHAQPQTLTKSMGNVNNGTHPVNLSFSPIAIDLDDTVVFNYLILNNGHSSQQTVDNALTQAGTSLAKAGAQAAATAIGSGVGALVGASVGSAVVPLIGTALGALAGWLVSELTGIIFANCDGPVAAEQATFTGWQLHTATLGGAVLRRTTTHPGTDSATGCGSNSVYKVTWSVSLA